MAHEPTISSNSAFGPTRWTLVVRSQGNTPEARAALSELCEAYYQPVFAFLRREGRDEEAARELAHDFFAYLLERGTVGNADPLRGRFRSYLLGALKHYLADRREREGRLKRGGGLIIESLDAPLEGKDAQIERDVASAADTVPDTWFDRQWALTVMARALSSLEAQFAGEERSEQYTVLKPWLAGDASALNPTAAAERLGLSESAFKVAVHRLRKRFRETVQREVAQTMPEGADLHEELRYLVEVLASAPR